MTMVMKMDKRILLKQKETDNQINQFLDFITYLENKAKENK
jgi:hypothetical protein